MSWLLRMFEGCGHLARRYLNEGFPREQALQKATSGLGGWVEENLGSVVDDAAFQVAISMAASCGLAWLENTFATVRLGHKLAASLCCTSVPEECAGEIVPPFRCFALVFPQGLLPNLDCGFFLQARSGAVFFHVAGPQFFQVGMEGHFAGYAGEDWIWKGPTAFDERMEPEKRKVILAQRMLLGTCIEMMRPEQRERVSARVSKLQNKSQNPRGGREPTRWNFQVTRDVRLDVREQVHAYVRGQVGGRLSLQRLVRGHMKRQPHGPQASLRKWMHIEPYWQGPEDAPIAKKGHIL